MHRFRSRLWQGLLLAAVSLAAGAAEQKIPLDPTLPLPGETVVLERLNGIVCVPDAAAVSDPVAPGFSGVDTSRTPLLGDPAAARLMQAFLGKPASFGSLGRLEIGVRAYLRALGQPFVVVFVPPQELTGGVVKLVVRRARLDGEIRIEGARWFSEESYRAALPVAAGEEIDAAKLQAGVERLNRNPYRNASLAAESGSEPGTTRLTLRAQEVRPWGFSVGANNYGTEVTGETRITAGATWGNAFGRGDILGYNYSADPDFRHYSSHSLNYATQLASGNSLTVFGARARIDSLLPEPLTQTGGSWQIGARYGVPLGRSAGGWDRSLTFAADFKYSDNTLEFAAIPVTNNVTNIAQLGAAWSVRREGAALTASLYASPGKLTNRNDDASFDVARAGAKASYAYARLDGQYSHPLPRDFAFSINASAQAASGPLLGTEQLAGGGYAAVRAYPENSAFGDDGVLVNAVLYLPAFMPFDAGDPLRAFVFRDAAWLHNQGPDGGNLNLSSFGFGLAYQIGRRFSLAGSYGRELKEIPATIGKRATRGHIAVVFSF